MADGTRPARRARGVSLGLLGLATILVAALPMASLAADGTTGSRGPGVVASGPSSQGGTTKAKRPRPSPTPTSSPSATRTPIPTTAPAPTPAGTPAPTPTSAPTLAPAPTPTATFASSTTKWVSTSGSDAADGSSLTPWLTIQYAVDHAPAGATIVVRDGTYAGFTISRPWLTVEAAAGASPVISGGTYVVLVHGTNDVVVRGLTIRDAPLQWGSGVRVESSTRVRIEGDRILENHSFGIKVKDATSVTIQDNEILKNDTGIELSGSVGGTVVRGNRIHDNDRMVTSSRGGNAIVVTGTSGAVLLTSNRIWGNRAKHLADSGYDGGAFEIYAASDVRIEDNVLWDNNNVMETGTDGAPCARLTFVRNVAYGAGTVTGETTGLILRCASESLFAHNTFDGLDDYAFYVAAGGAYAGSIAALRIEDNIVYRGRAYSLTTGLPADLVIDRDLVQPGGSSATYGSHVAYVAGRGNTDSLSEFRTWTGFDANGIQANPRFVDADGRDYHLTSGSPAIDAGVDILGAPYIGVAPDIGRYEYGQ